MKVIALEGINGAGKSSVGALLRRTLLTEGRPCLLGDPAAFGPTGQLLRKRIVRPSVEANPDIDAVLFAALRAEGARGILEAVKSEPATTVVLERWSLALAAYGAADGAPTELVSELRAMLNRTLKVDLTVLLDLDGRLAFERIGTIADPNKFEAKGPAYFEKVAGWYRQIAAREEGNTVIVGASGDLPSTFQRVLEVVTSRWSDFLKSGSPQM